MPYILGLLYIIAIFTTLVNPLNLALLPSGDIEYVYGIITSRKKTPRTYNRTTD